jgi:integrase
MGSTFERIKDHRYLFRRAGWLYFRRAVPADVRPAFDGKAEKQVSLRTMNVAEARHSLQAELAKFEMAVSTARGCISPAQIANRQLQAPTLAEIEMGVREWFAERLGRVHIDYGAPEAVEEGRLQLASLQQQANEVARSMKLGGGGPALTTQWIAEALVERFEWALPDTSAAYRTLLRTVGRGQIEAAQRLQQDMEGEPRKEHDATFSPEAYRLDVERKLQQGSTTVVSLRALFDDYAAERKPAPATIKAYGRQIDHFIAFAGHDDVNRITPEDVVAWKNHLLTVPNALGKLRAAKTVGETYLAALKTVLGYGFENHRIDANPATRVRVRSGRKIVLRERGLNDDEARTILRATLLPPPKRLSPERAFARRWVPWLCAYTGARVDEMAQLRAEDVAERRGVWSILITPEAGRTKNDRARVVALHPHLIDQGFVKQVQDQEGYLFFDPSRHRGGSDSNPQSKKVGQHLANWVRTLGVDDDRVQPNHGWRHRFKSQARLVRMDPEIRDLIQGHVPRTESEDYGDTFPEASLHEIKRLSRYAV